MTALTRKSANELLEAYARQFGEAHLLLAMHAAVPLGLAPEMLHLIRINFVAHAPWIAEADLLLSMLCREAGDEMYQMKPEIREGLLNELKLDSEFGMSRIKEIAGFLYAWTERELNRSRSSIRKDFLKAQQLAAIAWLEPKRAAQLIAAKLQNAQLAQSDSELVRISKLTEQLAEPLMNEDDLLLYVAGVNHIESGQSDLANNAFAQLGSGSVSIAGADLSLPSIEQRTENREQRAEPEVVSQSNIGETDIPPDYDQGIDPLYDTDVFISYSKVDEGTPLNDSDDGPVLMFHEDLSDMVNQVLRISGSTAASNESQHDQQLKEILPKSAIMLIIHSRNWSRSEFAQQELQAFLEANRSQGMREGAIRNRIILLPLEPVDMSELPTELRHCAQLPLYREAGRGSVQLAHRESTGKALERYRKTMNDLANMLVSQLRITQNKELPTENYLYSSGGNAVFLSDASEDLQEETRRLAGQFLANDFQVLPFEPPGLNGTGSLVRYMMMRNCAERASIAVLPVGARRLELDIDGTDAVEFDNNISVEVTKQTGLPRIIWAPDQEEVGLGNNPDAFYGAEVVRGDYSELLEVINEKLGLTLISDANPDGIPDGFEEENTTTAPGAIYLSYYSNRYDEEWVPFRQKLVERFGAEAVSGKENAGSSKSVEASFQAAIEDAEMVLAMIGPQWLRHIQNANADQLNSYEDWMLFELLEASRQNKYIIPVLYGLDTVPTAPDLPPELQKLSEVEPLRISGENAERDIEYAISFIGGYLGGLNADFSNLQSQSETPAAPKQRVFMAYRDRNSGKMARRINEELSGRVENMRLDSHFGSIVLGQTARNFFKDRMEFSSAALIFIDKWFDEFINSDGDRLIDDPADWLRLQIEVALELNIPIIPILVDGADMPLGDELPESIRPITTRQAIRMDEQYFADDIDALARAVSQIIGIVAPDDSQGKKIFLSMNTGTDMTGHMRAALGAIKRSGHRRVEVADYGSATVNVYFQDLEELLKQTDLFVLILGERLPVLPGSDRSIIEEEYEIARRVGVQTRILLPRPTPIVKAAPGSEIDRLQEFRHQLEGENPVFYYDSPEDIHEGLTGFIESEFGYAEESVQQQTVDPVENSPQQQRVRSETVDEEVYFHPVDGSEYILIPGGKYTYSVTGQTVQIPDRWFGMYPVTNSQYARFIVYLDGKETKLEAALPVKLFKERLNEFARRIDGLAEYLYGNFNSLATHLGPESNEFFTGEPNHPVTGISWFAARIYCFWLGMLENDNVDNAAEIYSLPTEEEWEWAASGGVREWPWPDETEGSFEDLANVAGYIGRPTPVDRYPRGATPEGLMDMAGNVWEWCANRYSNQNNNRSLRGGAWYESTEMIRCSARNNFEPHNANTRYGFRVVRREGLPADMSDF